MVSLIRRIESPIHPLLCGMEFFSLGTTMPYVNLMDKECLNELSREYHWADSEKFEKFLYNDKYTLIVTDSNQKIVWVSMNFEKMTGYKPSESVGRFPKFLQGERTSLRVKLKIRNHLQQQQKIAANVVNYKKDGSSYICSLRIVPIFNKENILVNYLAIEREMV